MFEKLKGMESVNRIIVILIATSFVFIGFSGLSQINAGQIDEMPTYLNVKLDKDLQGVTGIIDVRINLQRNIDVRAIANLIENLGVKINRINTVSVNYLETTMDASLLTFISGLDEVTRLQQMFEPQVLMDHIQSNTFMGADTPQANGFAGSGILAEVVDDGCDFTHTDLGQVQFTDFTPVASSHGTCTTGIMFGDGTGDINAQGDLYEATGVFGDWGNGNALGISHLWAGTFTSGNAGQNGVVQTNSWWNGAAMDGQYDAMSNEIDQAIVDNPKVLTHWAIGNSNSGESEGLMSAESISKNNMAVGAIYHKDTASTADDDWSSNGAGNTPSRGPAADGRAKPDMLACFDWIYTVDQMGGAGYTGTNYYNNFGGTSGATPTVAGMSGLAYEMFQENYFDNNPTGEWPYSCTIKALMIADAFQYPMTGGNLITRNVQGWGSPDMQNMYNLADQYHVIEEYPQALNGGDSWSRGVFSDGVNPLKITLAWVDPAAPPTTIAGRALINNLDLHVTSPSGTQYWGNNGLGTALYSSSGTGAQRWSTTSSYRDDLNNVENVFILAPEVGVWTVEVQGRSGDIAQGPQDFSVVASGAAGISSMGTVDLDKAVYLLEDTATITVADLDLDTNSGTIQTVNVNVASSTEPLGETVLLTETAVDSATFDGTIILSATDGGGILHVTHADLVTATYNDADDGTGSPAIVTDTANVDGLPPGPVTGLTVEWWGETFVTLIDEHFLTNPTGWTITSTAGTAWTWSAANQRMENTYGYPNSGYLDSPVVDCSFVTGTTLSFWHLWTANYATGVQDGFVRGSIDGGSTWPYLIDEFHHNDPATEDAVKGPYALAWADGQSQVRIRYDIYNNDDWYWRIDDVLMTAVGGSTTEHNWLNWTLSADDGAGANDVSHYNIYRALGAGGPWTAGAIIDTVPAGTATYMDLGRGEPDGINWWYVVRAEDFWGNEELNVNAVPEIPVGGTPYNINLAGKSANSWVFVSFPHSVTGNIQTLLDDTVFGDSGTTWTVAKWLNVQDKADPWKTYRVGSSMNDMPVLTNQMGVWLWITSNGGDQQLTLSVNGDYSVAPIPINLYTGWNLVGYPSVTSRLGTATLPAQADYVSVWQVGSPYISDMAPGAVTLSHGNAYWVHVTADCTWVVNP